MIGGLSAHHLRTRWRDKSLSAIFLALNELLGQTVHCAAKRFGANTYPSLTMVATFRHRKINYPSCLFPSEKMRAIDPPSRRSGSNARDSLPPSEEMLIVDEGWRCGRTIQSARQALTMRLLVLFALRTKGLWPPCRQSWHFSQIFGPLPFLRHHQTGLVKVWPDSEVFESWTSGEDAHSPYGTRGVWAKL